MFLHTFSFCNSSPAPKGKASGTSWQLEMPPEWGFSSNHRQSCFKLGLTLRGSVGQLASEKELVVPGGLASSARHGPLSPWEPLLSIALCGPETPA